MAIDLRGLAREMNRHFEDYRVLSFEHSEITDEVLALVELQDGTQRRLVFSGREIRLSTASPSYFIEAFDRKMAACDQADARLV